MPETPFPSVIQRMIDCQIGSGNPVFRFRPGFAGWLLSEIQSYYNMFI